MKKLYVGSALVVVLGCVAGGAQASGAEDGLHFALAAGLTTGGDELFQIKYTNGDNRNIKAGNLAEFGLGVLYQSPDVPVAGQLTFNYHFDRSVATNANAKFDRYPVEGIVYYTGVQNWRFGAGLREVFNAKGSASIDGGDSYDVTFDTATGYLAEVGYEVADNFWINLRAVSEKYKIKSFKRNGNELVLSGDNSVSGNHVGINILWGF